MSIRLNVIKICLILLSVIIFCNLNGLFFWIFGVTSGLSGIILTLCCIILYYSIFIVHVRYKNLYLFLFLLFIVSYLYFGGIASMLNPSYLNPKTSVFELYRNYISSGVIVCTYFYGIKAMVKSSKEFNLYSFFLPFLLVSNSITILGPLIGLTDNLEFAQNFISEDRNSGLFSNPNEAGAIANYTLLFSLFFLLSYKNKFIFIILILIIIYVTILTFSKAAFFTMILLFLIYFYFSLFKLNDFTWAPKVKSFLFLILLTIVVFFTITSFNEYKANLTQGQLYRVEAIQDILTGKFNRNSTSERDQLWVYGVDLIMEQPILGHGIGSFHRFNSFEFKLGVHNTFLMVIGESGILPLIFIVFLLILIFMDSYKCEINHQFFIIGVIVILVANEYMTNHHAIGLRYSNAMIGVVIFCVSHFRKKNLESA